MKTLAELFVWSGTRPRPSHQRITPGVFGFQYEDVQFVSAFEDAVQLSGWLIKPVGAAIASIVLCHGHTSTRADMLKRAILMSKHHFTTLLFDFRARGLSGGERCTMGHLESYDIIGALNYLKSREDTSPMPIGIIGNSMGGAAAICAAAGDKRIRAVVTEGTFASLRRVVERRVGLATGPFASRVTDKCAEVGAAVANLDINSVCPEDVIASISPRPVYLITDGLDVTCPRRESDRLFEAAREPKQRWIAARAPHMSACAVYPDAYESRISGFLTDALAVSKRQESPP